MTDVDIRLQVARLEEQLKGRDQALELQAQEYERRLGDLNHAHEQALEVQKTTVSAEVFEKYAETESEKRELALNRVDEKFEDYVKRYEQRQREVDLLLNAQKASVETAQRIAEEQGRKANRNIAIASAVLVFFIGVANFFGGGI